MCFTYPSIPLHHLFASLIKLRISRSRIIIYPIAPCRRRERVVLHAVHSIQARSAPLERLVTVAVLEMRSLTCHVIYSTTISRKVLLLFLVFEKLRKKENPSHPRSRVGRRRRRVVVRGSSGHIARWYDARRRADGRVDGCKIISLKGVLVKVKAMSSRFTVIRRC